MKRKAEQDKLEAEERAKNAKKAEMEKLQKSLGADLNWAGVEFMRKKSRFVIDLARLAKFWSQTVYYDGCRNGKSFLVELVAVCSATVEEEAISGQRRFFNFS